MLMANIVNKDSLGYSSSVNINYLFHFLTEYMFFSNHRQQFGQGLAEDTTDLQRKYQICIGHGIYYSGLRLYSSYTCTSYPFASNLFMEKRNYNKPIASFSRLTPKLFSPENPQLAFAIVPIVLYAVKPSYNYSLFFHCIPAENRSH